MGKAPRYFFAKCLKKNDRQDGENFVFLQCFFTYFVKRIFVVVASALTLL